MYCSLWSARDTDQQSRAIHQLPNRSSICNLYTVNLKTRNAIRVLDFGHQHDFSSSLRKLQKSVTTDDFNSGKALVGTSPFKFSNLKRSDRIKLLSNDAYWDEKLPLDKVTFHTLTSDGLRLAAFLAGEVDAI